LVDAVLREDADSLLPALALDPSKLELVGTEVLFET